MISAIRASGIVQPVNCSLLRTACHEHFQPAGVRDAERLRLQEQRRPRRVIDHIQHTGTVRKCPQVCGCSAVVRIHAKRRGVDEDLRVAVTAEIFVIVRTAA